MLKKIGVLLFIVIGLAQCAQQYITVVNKETGESQPLLESWIDGLFPSAAAVPYINEASEHYASQDYSAAIKSFTKAIKVDPKSTQAYLGRGYSYQNLRQHNEAIKDFDKAVQLDPELAEAYVARGRSYRDSFENQKAIEDFSRAIQLDPRFVEAYIDRGWTYFLNADDLEKVIDDLDTALEIEPNSLLAYKYRGVAYMDVGNSEQALKDFDIVIDMEPGNAENYRQRALIFTDLEDLEKALDDYSKAINLDTDFGMAYQERGFIHLRLDNIQEAIQDFTQGIELLEKSLLEATLQYLPLFGRGIAYARQGEWDLAISDFSDSIEISDTFAFTYRERGYVYIQLEEYEMAKQDLEMYLSLAPDSADKEEIAETLQTLEPYLD